MIKKHPTKQNHPLVVGTIILTLTGLISRVIGFFYRIFLSRQFGAEGMGIYQLISPILALSFSVTVAGVQTAVSKFVAGETTTHDYKSSVRILLVAFVISMLLSLGCGYGIYVHAEWLAVHTLFEPRCAPLLRIIALSIPFSSIHCIINGYFYGIKQTKIPAATQLLEQLVRVASVYLIASVQTAAGGTPSVSVAVVGIVLGEIASMLLSLLAVYVRFYKAGKAALRMPPIAPSTGCITIFKNIALLSLPLSANRVIVNLLQSVESVYIPNRLQAHGMSVASALSVYGILTGMALPLILFPSALTNSVAVLLLPIVSEAESNHNPAMIQKAVHKSIRCCLLLGAVCTTGFFLFGPLAGSLLFQSEAAGSFIRTLSFICPFLYLSATLGSILHGLGRTATTFVCNVIGLSIRLLFVFFAVPLVGIKGYLWGLLCSQLVITGLLLLALREYIYYNNKQIFSESLPASVMYKGDHTHEFRIHKKAADS